MHQDADSRWKIARPEDQVSDNEAETAEEEQAHAKAIAMRFERQARQGVELFRRKCFEVSGIPQRKQRLKEIHRSRGFDARSEEHTLNSSHVEISYAVFCLKKKNNKDDRPL